MRRHSHHGFGLRLYFQGLNLHRIWMEKLHTHNSKDLCETKTGCSSAFLAKDSDFGLSVLAIFSDLAWAAEAGADLKLRNLSTSPPCVLVPPLPSPPPSAKLSIKFLIMFSVLPLSWPLHPAYFSPFILSCGNPPFKAEKALFFCPTGSGKGGGRGQRPRSLC